MTAPPAFYSRDLSPPGSVDQFDASVTSLLIGLGGEKYVEIFRSRNITQETLMELTEDDLAKLGVDDPHIRATITREIKNFPVYEQINFRKKIVSDLDLEEISTMLRDSNQHLHRIYLSMLSVSLSLRRINMQDAMISDRTVTSVIKTTLDELSVTLNKLEYNLESKFKCLSKDYNRRRKIMIGSAGGVAIGILAVLFVYSLKHAK
ncbi:uncharacterized protein [Epargyreus clarus]|uniref:uncharacterized protein n=1 Tax=Epargyreus clarus TaxID=520877 RepID=UPI003C2D35A4